MRVPKGPEELTAAWLSGTLGPGEGINGFAWTRIGAEQGFDSVLARVELHGGHATRSIVAKWASARQGRAEQVFYEGVGPCTGLDLPGFYGAVVDEAADRAVLFLEDLTSCRAGDFLAGATPEDALAMARAEGGMHARLEGHPALEALPAWAPDPVARAARFEARIPPFLERYGTLVSSRLRARLPAVARDLPAAAERVAARPHTLIHGDLHLDNVLFRPDGAPVFLDWPSASRGHGARDLLRIVQGLRPDVRRGHEAAVVRAWVSACAEVGPAPEPDALEDALRDECTLMLAAVVGWAAIERTEDRPARIGATLREEVVRTGLLADDLLG